MTGTLWAGDVGQGAREEIDTIVAGGNYGWRLMEGTICTPNVNPDCRDTAGTILPLWDYGGGSGDVSVTGGYVYRGNAIPFIEGRYVYADYASGTDLGSDTEWIPQPPTNALLLDSPHTVSSLAARTAIVNSMLCQVRNRALVPHHGPRHRYGLLHVSRHVLAL